MAISNEEILERVKKLEAENQLLKKRLELQSGYKPETLSEEREEALLKRLEHRTGRRDILKALAGMGILGAVAKPAASTVVTDKGIKDLESVRTENIYNKSLPIRVYKDGNEVVAAGETEIARDTDATAVIQSALDQGGHIVIEDGTYVIDSQLTISAGTVIEGRDLENVVIQVKGGIDGSDFGHIFNGDDNDGIIIRNITFDCNTSNLSGTPAVGAIRCIRSDRVLAENNRVLDPKNKPVIYFGYDKTKYGFKIIRGNEIHNPDGDGACRIPLSINGIIANNIILGGRTTPEQSWSESCSIEGSEYSAVIGNVIYDQYDRGIRASGTTKSCVIADNVIWVPTPTYDTFDDVSPWSALRGDESLSQDTTTVKEGDASLEVAGGTTDNPGIEKTGVTEDWSDYARAWLWINQPSSNAVRLHLEDSGGNWEEYEADSNDSGVWYPLTFDLTSPADSSGTLDKTDISVVQMWVVTTTDSYTFNFDALYQTYSTTQASIMAIDSETTTIEGNVIHGEGWGKGSIDVRDTKNVNVNGNIVEYSVAGINGVVKQEGANISDNTLFRVGGGISGWKASGNTLVASAGIEALEASNNSLKYSGTISGYRSVEGNTLFRSRRILVQKDNCRIIGNEVEYCQAVGASIDGQAYNNLIIALNNLRREGLKTAISVDSPSSNCQIKDNRVDNFYVGLDIKGSGHKVRGNIVTATDYPGLGENSATSTFSGDGTATVFDVSSHGLAENPSDRTRIKAYVTPQSADAEDASPVSAYPADLDADGNFEGLKIVFASAPASGTDNVKVKWYAELD